MFFMKTHIAQEWAKQYGDIIGLKVGSLNMVILNSPELIESLFIKRGSIYSGRPIPYLSRNYIFPGQEQAFFFQNDAQLRRMRTSLKLLTGPEGLKNALPMQDRIASKLVTHLQEKTYSTTTSIGLWSFETAMTATMGPVGVEQARLEIFERWAQVQHGLLNALESTVSLLYDMVPALRFIPGSPGRGSAVKVGQSLRDLYSGCMSSLKRYLAQAEDCDDDIGHWGLIATILRSQEKESATGNPPSPDKIDAHYTEEALISMAQFTTDAATDTTTSVAMSLIVALAVDHEILCKAQAEVDQACSESGPTYTDIGNLPYVKACVKEVNSTRATCMVMLLTSF